MTQLGRSLLAVAQALCVVSHEDSENYHENAHRKEDESKLVVVNAEQTPDNNRRDARIEHVHVTCGDNPIFVS